mmetsp:Transcript_17548/g.48915  ORF Transcript_17548/g.48915 Transcript_17548/m.48915 type:complete len:320 (-) Transcript_17548:624-1583(-)
MGGAVIVEQAHADGVLGEVVEVDEAAHRQLLHVGQQVAHLLLCICFRCRSSCALVLLRLLVELIEAQGHAIHGSISHAKLAQPEAGRQVGSKQGSPQHDRLIRVHVLVQHTALQRFLQHRLHARDAAAAPQDLHLVDLLDFQARPVQHGLQRPRCLLKERPCQGLKLLTGDGCLVVNAFMQLLHRHRGSCVCTEHLLCASDLLPHLGHCPRVAQHLLSLEAVLSGKVSRKVLRQQRIEVVGPTLLIPLHFLHLELGDGLGLACLLGLITGVLHKGGNGAARPQVIEDDMLRLVSKVLLDAKLQGCSSVAVDDAHQVDAC